MPKDKTITEQLREQLFQTMEDLRAGKIDTNQAHAVSKLSDNIIKTVVVEMQVTQMLGLENINPINGETAEQRRQKQGGIVHKIS
ncbi:flagellar protein required for flagellar formation [Wielerella bovis]|uniref:flagellar protein required for flagellar formation n=1 Tax=Wielerella bovis TaxID=2917790 RepID=UPI00201950F1|nr:flagellar protein required for flagellar formation [Wielerella bovis]ULJ59769.1 flagellar protein required for flagellar formation [Wielerella bovis]ULJ67882.1 flagellar protein required for flagellar formation [Wielerella bovis]